jgi:hypothetical protein
LDSGHEKLLKKDEKGEEKHLKALEKDASHLQKVRGSRRTLYLLIFNVTG